MNTLILFCACINDSVWAEFLDEMPCTLIWIAFIIALTIFLKAIIPPIIMNCHERKMVKEKDERERWWQLHNEIKKDLGTILNEKVKENNEAIENKAKKEAKKEFEKNIKQEILEAEHDWYLKLLKDINGLKLDLKTEQNKDGVS